MLTPKLHLPHPFLFPELSWIESGMVGEKRNNECSTLRNPGRIRRRPTFHYLSCEVFFLLQKKVLCKFRTFHTWEPQGHVT